MCARACPFALIVYVYVLCFIFHWALFPFFLSFIILLWLVCVRVSACFFLDNHAVVFNICSYSQSVSNMWVSISTGRNTIYWVESGIGCLTIHHSAKEVVHKKCCAHNFTLNVCVCEHWLLERIHSKIKRIKSRNHRVFTHFL